MADEDSQTFAYMHVKSASQGVFLDDATHAGKSKSLCLAVRFRGDLPADVRKGAYAVANVEPITVLREWSESTVQFMNAFWNNEVIEEITFDFMRPDNAGKEAAFASLTLKRVTVTFVELRSGDTAPLLAHAPRTLEYLGLQPEVVSFKILSARGTLDATYDRKAGT